MAKPLSDPAPMPAYMITPDLGATAGAAVWWVLSGLTNPMALRIEWATRGLGMGDLPSMPSPAAALARAMASQRGPRQLVRPLEGKDGWALVNESAMGSKVSHAQALAVKISPAGSLLFDPPGHAQEASIAADYQVALVTLASDDISPWLIRMAGTCMAVRLRETGGFYFIPAGAPLARWNEIVSALRGASGHSVYGLPAMKSDEAVVAILDAVTAEATALNAELAEEAADPALDLGERALNTRARRVDGLRLKVMAYEALLGVKAQELAGSLQTLHAGLVAKALAASLE